MIKLLLILCVFLMTACGAPEEEIVYADKQPDDVVAYSWAEMQTSCMNCHNSSAPAIPLTEADFKASAKVKTRIANGSMPPTKGDFDKSRALKYLEVEKKEEAKEDKPSGGYEKG